MSVRMYVYISKYISMLSLYTHTQKYVFRAHHLVLEKQLLCSFLRKKTVFLALGILGACSSLAWVKASWAFPQPC